MNERSTNDHSSPDEATLPAGAQRLRARLAVAESRGFLSLIPRRDLTKVVLLLVILIVIVSLQRRSDSIVKRLTEGLFGPPPPARVQPKEAPRVRLAVPEETP